MSITRGLFNWRCRGRNLELGRVPRIMGVLNVTPDSFSDGGLFNSPDGAVERGLRLAFDGADILDVGGESTRPGSREVSEQEEMDRVLPVIAGLASRSEVLLSVDTSKAVVAREALEAGAHIINDVSGFREFDAMVEVAKEADAGVVLMHMQGRPESMQDAPSYHEVVGEVTGYLLEQKARVLSAGLSSEQVVLDPGIGFGKTLGDNLALLRAIPLMVESFGPIVIGLSRKRMLGELTGRLVGERLPASLAGLAWAHLHGAHIIRVHDVKESCDSVKILSILSEENGNRR